MVLLVLLVLHLLMMRRTKCATLRGTPNAAAAVERQMTRTRTRVGMDQAPQKMSDVGTTGGGGGHREDSANHRSAEAAKRLHSFFPQKLIVKTRRRPLCRKNEGGKHREIDNFG